MATRKPAPRMAAQAAPRPTAQVARATPKPKPKPGTGTGTGNGNNNQTNSKGGSLVIGPTRDAAAAQLNPAAQSQGAQLDVTNDNQFRGSQQALIGQLQAQANGTGPSVAQEQFKATADRNIAQQMGMAASMRGAGNALAGRQAMLNSAGINQDLAAQSAIQRNQEMINAQNQLGNVVNQGRTADENVANQNATLQQGNQQFNATSQNDINKAQGILTNTTNVANAGSTNQARIAQAQINQADTAATKYSSAQLGAAQAQAGAIKSAAQTQASTAAYIAQLNALSNGDNQNNTSVSG